MSIKSANSINTNRVPNASTWRTVLGYAIHLAIAIGCGSLAWHIGPETLQAIVAAPGAVSLAAIPWQIFRDQRAHERAIELADRNSAIALGVGSPMAQAAFNSYVDFAQAYADEVAKIIGELVARGPSRSQLELSQRLFSLRRKHALWIPQETDVVLDSFENKIWHMAVDAGFTEATLDRGEEWHERYENAHRAWCNLVGLKYESPFQDRKRPSEVEVEVNLQRDVLRHLRQVLGTEDFAAIRKLAISRALPTDRLL